MRRFIVLSSLFLSSVAAIGVLAIASPAGAERLAPRIVCPQSTPGCCPIPVNTAHAQAAQPICCPGSGSTSCCTTTCCSTVCCPSTACCTGTSCPSGAITIASSPNPSTAARKVVISGVLSGSSASGAQVVLWRELGGQSSWQQLAQSTTDSSGHYTFTLTGSKVMADQEWYVTSGSLRSGTIDQQVKALVGLTPSTRSIAAGQTIVLHGHVAPSHAGQVVRVEQRRGRSWDVIARPRLSKGSTFALSHRFAQAGKSEFRAVLLVNVRNAASSSPVLTLMVRS